MIDSNTRLIGLLGSPIVHSKSPQMHNNMFQLLNLNYKYIAFDVKKDNLEAAINGIRALGFRGLNITIPHKVEVMKYLDEIDGNALALGAVNTVVNESGRLIGYNTDGEGYVKSLIEETSISLNNKRILILGAGGAARAISYALTRYPIKSITIVNRDNYKADSIVKKLRNRAEIYNTIYDNLGDITKNTDIIINTTSIGMYPNINHSLLNKEWINKNHIVSDIIYNPLKTMLIKDAEAKGARIHTGLGMFVYQGAIAFEKWTGVTPNTKIMREFIVN